MMGQVKSRQKKSKPNLNQRTANIDKPYPAGIPKDNLTSKEDSLSTMATKESNSAATHVDDTNIPAHEEISTTDGQGSTTSGACAIDMLTDDALLSIFSHLVLLCDRGQVARTCKRWHRLMKEPVLWQTLDFWTGGGFRAEEKFMTWQALQFPLDADLALKVLETYPKSALRRVYIRVANLKILRYLTKNCPNLKTLSFVSQLQDLPLLDEDALTFFQNGNFVLPESLTELQLSSEVMRRYKDTHADTSRRMARGNVYIHVTQEVLNTVIQCQNLRHLSIANCKPLSREQVDSLTAGLPNLQELWLLYLYDFAALGVYDESTGNVEDSPIHIARNLHDLTSLRFVPFEHGVRPAPPSNNIDDALQELSQRSNLRELHLGDVDFTPRAFANMTEKVDNLEELVLLDCISVTDEILEIVAKNLPGLKALGLPLGLARNHGTSWRNTTYTGRGLKALTNHPSLRSISFYRLRGDSDIYDLKFPSEAVVDLFEMLMTLPKVQIVRGLGCFKFVGKRFEKYWTQLFELKPHVQARGSMEYCVYMGSD